LNPCSPPQPEHGLPKAEVLDSIAYGSCWAKTVVVGVGNRFMRDDGIGVLAADELARTLTGNVQVCCCQTADLSFLAQFEGASKIILVDALRSGELPGVVTKYTIIPSKAPLDSIPGSHSLELSDMFDIAAQAGLLTCPVTIVGVEPKDISVGEGISTELIQALPKVLSAVIDEVGSM
jgi:hydrogenase maturation protease